MFTAAANPKAIWNSRWSAPEITEPRRSGDGKPESKQADVFAFGMLAVEVFTGEVPFQKHAPAVAALCVLKGERPEKPRNAQQIGLTGEMWELLESCWHQDPEKRPTMEEVVRRWQRSVRNEGKRDAADTQTPPSHDQLRETPPAPGPSRPLPEVTHSTPSEFFSPGGYRFQALMHRSRASET